MKGRQSRCTLVIKQAISMIFNHIKYFATLPFAPNSPDSEPQATACGILGATARRSKSSMEGNQMEAESNEHSEVWQQGWHPAEPAHPPPHLDDLGNRHKSGIIGSQLNNQRAAAQRLPSRYPLAKFLDVSLSHTMTPRVPRQAAFLTSPSSAPSGGRARTTSQRMPRT